MVESLGDGLPISRFLVLSSSCIPIIFGFRSAYFFYSNVAYKKLFLETAHRNLDFLYFKDKNKTKKLVIWKAIKFMVRSTWLDTRLIYGCFKVSKFNIRRWNKIISNMTQTFFFNSIKWGYDWCIYICKSQKKIQSSK